MACGSLFSNRTRTRGKSPFISKGQFASNRTCGLKCRMRLGAKHNIFRCNKGICYFFPSKSSKEYFFGQKFLEEVSKNYWYLDSFDYATCRPRGTDGRMLRLHQICCETGEGLVVDHIDENKCNNLSSNLERVSFKENIRRYWAKRR